VPIALYVVGDDFTVGGDDLPAALACFVLVEMNSSLRLPFWRNGVCPACIQAFRRGYPAMRQDRKTIVVTIRPQTMPPHRTA
jgi:hypothetical protein